VIKKSAPNPAFLHSLKAQRTQAWVSGRGYQAPALESWALLGRAKLG